MMVESICEEGNCLYIQVQGDQKYSFVSKMTFSLFHGKIFSSRYYVATRVAYITDFLNGFYTKDICVGKSKT